MSVNVSGANAQSATYRLISPQITCDASGTSGNVSANSKFNTNIPFNYAMQITSVTWVVPQTKLLVIGHATGSNITALLIGQLTEALARTTPSLTDPLFIDDYLDELAITEDQNTAGPAFFPMNRLKAYFEHTLSTPWLSSAQQLNIIGSYTGNGIQNGGAFTMQVIVEYQLIAMTPSLQAYLAQRVQITGQA